MELIFNETSLSSILTSPVGWQLNVPDLLIGIGIAIATPLIYYHYQQWRKKQHVKKFWENRKNSLDELGASTPVNSIILEVKDLIFELGKLELFVGESFNEVDYIAYTNKIRSLNHLLNAGAPPDLILRRLRVELENLIEFY